MKLFVPWIGRRAFERSGYLARRDGRLIVASGLFDISFYLMNGKDVHETGADANQHFCDYGWKEGRRPNLYFDPVWYCGQYLRTSDANPLVHYITEGERAGCRPICFFDPIWYRANYALDEKASSLRHYLKHRRTQRVAPNRMFDLSFYLERHRDEIGANRDPFMHFVRHGAALRDFDPSPDFKSAAYRRDVMGHDGRSWVGLQEHEMRVPLIHYIHGLATAPEA